MSERAFRLILGSAIITVLSISSLEIGIYVLIGLLFFEGITNWRIPILVSKIRYGKNYKYVINSGCNISKIRFDAERVQRLIMAIIISLTFIPPALNLLPDTIGFFPWFIGFMLLSAGISNICPMVMLLRWLGFR